MESLKRNYDFQKVYTEGKSYANRYLVMYLLKNKTEKNRTVFGMAYGICNEKTVCCETDLQERAGIYRYVRDRDRSFLALLLQSAAGRRSLQSGADR